MVTNSLKSDDSAEYLKDSSSNGSALKHQINQLNANTNGELILLQDMEE